VAAPAQPRLTFVRGDGETVQLLIASDAAGVVPVDLTGRTYTMSIGTTLPSVVVAKSGTVTAASGLVSFVFAAADTTLLIASSYDYEIVETYAAIPSTLVLTTLTVLAAVTA